MLITDVLNHGASIREEPGAGIPHAGIPWRGWLVTASFYADFYDSMLDDKLTRLVGKLRDEK